MEYLWVVWVLAGIVFTIAEIFTLGFVLLWFGIGAFAAALVALTGLGVTFQVLVFLAVSISLTVASRTIFEKALSGKKGSQLKTGMAALPGQMALVVTASQGTAKEGAVKVFGSTWTAVPLAGEEPLEEGEQVCVDRVDGNILYVKRQQRAEGSWR